MDDVDRLRRLAFNLAAADAHPPTDDWLETSLDPKTLALVRLGAVVAMGGGAVASYGALTDDALAAGATVSEVVDVLFGALPIVGTARVVAAAPALALALGHDTDDIPGAERSEQ
jgi:alkylhydroperoxidase/carboxymuconolactone decarboxylase family protein YurZ